MDLVREMISVAAGEGGGGGRGLQYMFVINIWFGFSVRTVFCTCMYVCVCILSVPPSLPPGHPLTLKQSDIGIKGWAVEARVYAEVRGHMTPM